MITPLKENMGPFDGVRSHQSVLLLIVLLSTLSFVPMLPAPVLGADHEKSITQVVEEQGKAVLVITNLGFGDAPQGVGSGFVIGSNGVVLTNYHVIEHAQAVTVKLPDGRELRAKGLLGSDSEADVAVLKLDVRDLPTIPLGDSDTVKVGQRVIAIGNPLGIFEYTVSDGIISAIRGDDKHGKVHKLIQITAPISQGSSGGPLLDLTGKVIGITTAISMQGQNLNFAIPINVAKPLIKDGPVLSFNEGTKGLNLPEISDCPVIGNMKSGVYHLPGGQYYAQMQFSMSAICFKSEEEAVKNGYRRSTR